MLRILFSSILVFTTLTNLSADIKITKIPAQQNASLNLIYNLYQDSKSFLWMGTMFGLIRYDGREFKNFRYDPNNKNSISGDDVVSVMEDSYGYIWTGSFKSGVNRYNPETGEFKRITDNTDYSTVTFWSICEIGNKIFFGSDRGLFLFENNEFKKIDYEPFNRIAISALETDGFNLWIGSMQKGVIRTNTDLNNYIHYQYDSLNNGTINFNSVNSIKLFKNRIYIGYNKNGLGYFKNLNTDSLEYERVEKLDTFNLNNVSITSLATDNEENLFIGNTNGGLIYNYIRDNVIYINSRLNDENPFKNFNTSLFDKSGVLWLGSYFDGLYKITDEIKNFYTFGGHKFLNNRALYQDEKENLWISTNRALYHYSGDLIFYDSSKMKNIFNKYVNSIITYKNKVWVGAGAGLAKFDINGNVIEDEIKINNKLPFINRLFVSKENKLYVASNMGLFESDGETFTEIVLDSLNSPFDKSVISIFIDSDNILYAGTFNGLYISYNHKDFIKYTKTSGEDSSLSNNYVYSFYEKSKNEIILGTAAGINIYDKISRKIIIVDNNLLLKKVILSINKDGDNYWFNTNSGISKYNFNENSLIQFNAKNGLNDDYYFPNSGLILKNGYYLGGGQTGITYFRPKMIRESNYKPEIIFSYIKITGKDSSFTRNLFADKTILEQDENNFELVFSSNDFNDPENIEYVYRINNGVWENPGNINKIFFTNLSPGEYKIDISGSNSDGVMNNKIYSKIIYIKPPFYKTNLFYLSSFILIAFLFSILYKYRTERKIKHILEIEKAKETERETFREQAAKDYHDELGHKLTRILLYTRNINKKIKSGNESDVINELKNIEETSLSLKNSARDLIWSINPVEDSVYDLALRVKDFAEEILEPADIKFNLIMDDNSLKYIDLPVNVKRNLIFIFKEAINNSVKYSGSKNITFKILMDGSNLEFKISDDGIGFNPDVINSGYGIKNIKERASTINSKIIITSISGKGTEITLSYNISSGNLIYNLN